MSDPFRNELFPRGVLWAAAGLVLAAMVLAAVGRLTGLGTTSIPDATAVEVVELRFLELPDDRLVVTRVSDLRPIADFGPNEGTFIRGVLRGFARERTVARIDANASYRLTRWSDGRLSVADTATGRSVQLQAFGRDNVHAFGVLLAAP